MLELFINIKYYRKNKRHSKILINIQTFNQKNFDKINITRKTQI
jgi:hypothetical protein